MIIWNSITIKIQPLKNSVMGSQKVKPRMITWPSNLYLLGIDPKQWNSGTWTGPDTWVFVEALLTRAKAGAIRTFINGRLDGRHLVHPSRGRSPGTDRHEALTQATLRMSLESMMLSERRQTHKITSCGIALIRNIENRESPETKSRLVVARDQRESGNGKSLLNWDGIFFWGGKNILELDTGGVLQQRKCCWAVQFKVINIMLRDFHLRKTEIVSSVSPATQSAR